MDNENRVTNLKSLIITFGIILAVATAGTFAWLSYRTKDTVMSLVIGNVNNIQITLKPYQLDLELSPVLTYTSLDANQEYVTVSVVNNSSSPQYYELYYDISHIDNDLRSSNFKYTVLKTNDSTVVSQGNFSSASDGSTIYIIDEFTAIPANTTWNFRVYVWLDGTNNPNVSGNSFKANLQAELLGTNKPINRFIRKDSKLDSVRSTYVYNNNGIQFSSTSSSRNGEGVYIRSGTENNPYPIYYYRGDIDNNNIIFANFCWKMVRTTETGGIKLVYNGVPSNGTCNNTGSASRLSTTKAFSTSEESYAYAGYMYGTVYTFSYKDTSVLNAAFKYGSGFTYSGSTYTLTNTITSGTTWSSTYNTLTNRHYTCFNSGGTCSTIYYIYSTDSWSAYYIPITGGKNISEALNEMLSGSSNTTNSEVKTVIDNWYQSNMTSYTSYLEDTVWCNDRSIANLETLDPTTNPSDYYYNINFGAIDRLDNTYNPSVTCPNPGDSFTVSSANGNGKLTYPVGMLTADEVILAGGAYGSSNEDYYLYTGENCWTMSPGYMDNGRIYGYLNDFSGPLGSCYYVNDSRPIRPSVSLRTGLTYSGSGTSSNPYTVS